MPNQTFQTPNGEVRIEENGCVYVPVDCRAAAGRVYVNRTSDRTPTGRGRFNAESYIGEDQGGFSSLAEVAAYFAGQNASL